LQLQGEDFSDITSTITRFFSVPPCLHGEIFLICAYQRSSAAKGLVFSISAIFGIAGSSGNFFLIRAHPRLSAVKIVFRVCSSVAWRFNY